MVLDYRIPGQIALGIIFGNFGEGIAGPEALGAARRQNELLPKCLNSIQEFV